MTEGFFFAQQTPCGAEREKSGRHKPLQCRRAQPVDDQSGRRPRRRLGERHGTTLSGRGAHRAISRLRWERMGKRGVIMFQCFATRANGQSAERGGEMSAVEVAEASCVGMYGDSVIAAAGVRRGRTKAACRPGLWFAHQVISGRRTDAMSLA